jgi:FxsC-like protein
VPPIKEVQSAFHVAGTQLAATAPAPPSIGKFAQFAFIAGRRTELEALRKDVSAYGDEGGLDWQPFRPGVEDEVSILAQEVTSQEKLRYEAVPVDEHFAARLDQAKDERKIVVVIVDPWTLGLDAYRQLMKELDQRVLPNCVVVVPWNVSDSETVASRPHLQNVIRLSFENKAALEDPNLLLEGISSCKELKDEISKFFAQARLRLISIENVRQSASEGEGRLIPKPVVTGPGG